MSEPLVRKALPEDGPAILDLIVALANYEKLAPPDDGARERLLRDMFAAPARIDVYLCEIDGRPVGYAILFEAYSTFLALPTLFLEDLFVLPEYRGRKAGYALFRTVMAEAKRRGCGRLEWNVLTWNQLAIDFYERLGATRLGDWYGYRLTSEQIDAALR
jgi:GNAT superfamily N-acetyltransferase